MKLSFILKVFFYCFIAITIFLSGIYYLFLNNRIQIERVFGEHPFSELVYQHSWSKTNLTGKDILAGQKIKEQFTASANRLGGVGIKFNTHNRSISDLIKFRFKEEGKKTWYYEQVSKTNQIRQEVYWPFGFPPISDSEGKRYVFELESVKGTVDDAIAINSSQKSFVAEYTYPKQWLLEHKKQIPYFVSQKLISLISNLDNKFQTQIVVLAVLSLVTPFIIFQLKRLISIGIFVVRKMIKIIITFFLRFIFLSITIIRLLFYSLEFFFKKISTIYHLVPFLIIVSFVLFIIGISAVFIDQQVFLQDYASMSLSSSHKWEKSMINKGSNLAAQIITLQRPLDETSALQKGEKINGRFLANYNYLGTVSVGIFDFYRENTDKIIFRLREVGKTQWYYEGKHDTTFMRSNIIWPFGFSPIADSKGKHYEFEIESTKGKIGNAIALLPFEQSFYTKYSYSLSLFVKHPEEIFSFAGAKIYLPFSKIDRPSWVFLIILTLLPLLLYLFGLEKIKHIQFGIKAKNNGQIFGFELKKERFPVDDDREYIELFSKISIVLITIIVATGLIYRFALRTKDLDWFVFEFVAILMAGMFLGLGVLFNKKKVSSKIEKLLRFSVLIVFCIFLVVVFTNKMFSLNFLHYSMFIFLLISFIPMLPVIQNALKKKRTGGYFTIIGRNVIEIFTNRIFLVNILSVFVVITFFFETLLNTPNRRTYFVTWILTATFLSYIIFNYKFIFQSKLREYMPLLKIFKNFIIVMFGEIILILGASVFVFLAIRSFNKSYIYYLHSSFFVGPAQDIIRGKSLLYDTPSQYGYLSLYFISLVQRFIGGTVEIFDRFDTALYVVFAAIAGLIFYKLTKKRLYSYLLAIMYLGFSTFFSDYRDFIYPSSGPLRFGFGVLICFFLLYFPGRISFIVGTMLAAISVFWSIETGIYVVPAWLFTCFIIAWKKHGKSIAFVNEMFLKIITFLFFVFILGFGLLLREYRPELGPPNFYNYIQYSQMYKEGYFSVITPLYGNYYFYVFISILGLGVVFHMLTKKLNSWALPALAFIAIYNVAIHSYFVYRSWYSLIISNAGFLLIELVLIYKVLCDTGKFNKNVLKLYFGVPVIVFCTLFVFKAVYNTTSPVLEVVKYNYQLLTEKKLSTPPFLNSVAKDYNAKDKDIIVLSEFDVFYLSEAKAKNFLPLNPAVMTLVLPDWKKKYIDPKINKIPKGTLLIFDPYFQDPDPNLGKKLTFIKDQIKKLYNVSLIGEIEDNTVAQNYGPLKRAKLQIYRVGTKK